MTIGTDKIDNFAAVLRDNFTRDDAKFLIDNKYIIAFNSLVDAEGNTLYETTRSFTYNNKELEYGELMSLWVKKTFTTY